MTAADDRRADAEALIVRSHAATAAADIANALAPTAPASSIAAQTLSEPSWPARTPVADPDTLDLHQARAQIEALELRLERRRATARHAPTIRDRQKIERRLEALEAQINVLWPFAYPATTGAGDEQDYCRSSECGIPLHRRHEKYGHAGLCSRCWNLATRTR